MEGGKRVALDIWGKKKYHREKPGGGASPAS